MSTTTAQDEQEQTGLSGIVSGYVAKVRGGDVGSLPAILGLVALVLVFAALRPDTFPTKLNFANLIGQSSGVMVIAMGLVFVLLLGEIDLSAGTTGGVSAAVLGVTLSNHGWNVGLALLTAILTGTFIGLCLGLFIAKVGIPSFVVTLAAFLGFQGVILEIIGEGGTIGYRNDFVLKLNNGAMPLWLGWTLAVVTVAGYGLATFISTSRRRQQGLVAQPMLLWGIKTGALAIAVFAFVAFLSAERSPNPTLKSIKGVPNVVLVILILVVVLGYLLSRTSWGRHIYAVGGNAEAARRAGINVAWTKVSCFMMCSSVAALGGILIASRTNSVSPQTGGQSTLLYAVGAAVIGGTSLFGGKGKITDAVIGGLVIAAVANGMGLLNQPAGIVFIVTGIVLLLAATVDALSRRRAQASGRV
ncbi:ABC transporter permease [Nocardioides sp. Root1257]|uniref:sugar ABC transporter permease n=1 Tax=unclassified Nocardioides TaxID=2615069 RepID=UPI000701CED3|nr:MULTISPECIES: ABC transporter permease [unclassified Nocardioides]KQW43030.1 ABC transporter permease [Nocardioides sp. Root1257]KRC41898.1 ABC transporter permease [Nocardioides sp. Root224]